MTIGSHEELSATLLALEQRLIDPLVRRERNQVSALLADEFREFGSSGNVWSREETLNLLAAEADYSPPGIEDFTINVITPETVLATYKTVRTKFDNHNGDSITLRSSLWVYRHGQWQILFHKGTKVS